MRSLLFLAALATAAALYSSSDVNVVELGDKDFDKKTKEGVHLVEVYANWCGHCKAAAPEVKKAAKALKGIASIGVVDGDKAQGVAQKLGVRGFPTFKLIVDGKITDYNGPRDANGMVNAVMSEVQSLVKGRLGGKAGGSSKSSSSGGSKGGAGGNSGGNKKSDSEPGGGKFVVKGSASNFEDEVFNSNEPVLVEFYAPWCGHCKSLAAPLAEAAEELQGEAKIVGVDATVEQSLAAEWGVRGYPTLFLMPPSASKKGGRSAARDYNGGRDKDSIIAALRNFAEQNGGAVAPVLQLTSQQVWNDNCNAKGRVCVIAVLPSLYDENASKRNERIESLKEAAAKVGKRSLFRFLWTEVGSQQALESSLNVGMVPALFAVSTDKKIFIPHRGALDAGSVGRWVGSLATRSEGATPFTKAPEISKVQEWDGKDAAAAPAAAADEISLEELGL